MSTGLHKCAKVPLRRSKLISTENTALDTKVEIKQLDENRPYKYLGTDQRVKNSSRKWKRTLEENIIELN